MNKKLIRLTESDLHRIIKESVNNILTELDWKTYANAARKGQEYVDNNFDKDFRYFDKLSKDKDLRNKRNEYYRHLDNVDNLWKKADDEYSKGLGKVKTNLPSSYKDMYGSNSLPFGYEWDGDVNDNDFEIAKDNHSDMENYFNGKTTYQKGKGWTKK